MKESIIVSFAFVYLLGLCDCNKFDKFELPDMHSPNPFRMGKSNLIWEKAKRAQQLDDKRMAELFADLTIQDKRERELKQKLLDNTDADGMFEAAVRREMAEILKKYSLQEHFPKDKNKPDERGVRNGAYALQDENLRNLLRDAKNEGFTANEIETLQQELSHHQMKLDEFGALKEEYQEKHDKVDNSLENLDDQDLLWKELHAKNRAMKEKHQELKSSFEKLKNKSKNKKPAMSEFEDPRVIHLWTLAQKSGLAEQELDSIRKELTHFEHRIKKTHFMKDEIKKTKEKIEGGEGFDTEHLEKRQKDMEERHAHYEAMVDKHHGEIKTRLQKRLDEL